MTEAWSIVYNTHGENPQQEVLGMYAVGYSPTTANANRSCIFKGERLTLGSNHGRADRGKKRGGTKEPDAAKRSNKFLMYAVPVGPYVD